VVDVNARATAPVRYSLPFPFRGAKRDNGRWSAGRHELQPSEVWDSIARAVISRLPRCTSCSSKVSRRQMTADETASDAAAPRAHQIALGRWTTLVWVQETPRGQQIHGKRLEVSDFMSIPRQPSFTASSFPRCGRGG
jgi:hypothetical protein